MLEYHVNAHRLDSHGSLVAAKEASLIADTDLAGRSDAFNSVELLHTNIRKYGTISNTLALAVPIAGRIVRKA